MAKQIKFGEDARKSLYFGYLGAIKDQNGAAMSIGRTSTFLDIYFEKDLADGTLTEEQVQNTIIAYEPIWAIGTGKTATSEQANDAIKSIRDKICQIYGQNVANGVIIQYGGSVKSSNAKELFEMSDIDGGLVGGASLKSDEFAKIVNYAD